jgi:hypothetical protein
MSLPVLRGPSAAINWTRKLQACGQAAALAGGTANVRLVNILKWRMFLRNSGGPDQATVLWTSVPGLWPSFCRGWARQVPLQGSCRVWRTTRYLARLVPL